MFSACTAPIWVALSEARGTSRSSPSNESRRPSISTLSNFSRHRSEALVPAARARCGGERHEPIGRLVPLDSRSMMDVGNTVPSCSSLSRV